MPMIPLPSIADLGIPGQRPASFVVTRRVWRADRFGNRLEQIGGDSPVNGTISYSEDTDVAYQCTLSVADPDALRPLRDYLIPEITLTDPAGLSVTATRGHYLLLEPTTSLASGTYTGAFEGKDITYWLTVSAVGAVTWPAGTDTGQAARDLVLSRGYNPRQVRIPNTGVLLAQDTTPAPGTVTSKVLAETLLGPSGWYAPQLSLADNAIFTEPFIDWSTVTPRKTYTTADGIELIPPIEGEPERGSVRNRVIVRNIRHSETEPDIWAEARITNPAHPLYVDPQRPDSVMELAEVIDDPNVMDVALATARAESVLSVRASSLKKLRVRHLVDLYTGGRDAIGLDARYGANLVHSGTWRRRAWTIDLKGLVATQTSEFVRVEPWR